MIRSKSTFTFSGSDLILLFEVAMTSGYLGDIVGNVIWSIEQGAIKVPRNKLRRLRKLHDNLVKADL